MKVTIVGLGLIGASVAKALAGHAEISGVDSDAGTVHEACSQGTVLNAGVDVSLARGSDLVVIAVPVGSIVDTARTLVEHLGTNTVITDTGSTKADIVRGIDKIWPRFVGSHPIAGKEIPGYPASRADLFSGRTTIVTPGDATKSECIEQVKRLWETCGSRIVMMSPSRHDELMAAISHMPHLLSFTSMCIARDLHIHRDLLGAGFRDFTRIAASDPVMWRDIFLANKRHILKLIDDFQGELAAVREMIDRDRSSRLEDALRAYSTIRRDLYEDKG